MYFLERTPFRESVGPNIRTPPSVRLDGWFNLGGGLRPRAADETFPLSGGGGCARGHFLRNQSFQRADLLSSPPPEEHAPVDAG
jgi:hypothetical protein